jgi:hypothetical protein
MNYYPTRYQARQNSGHKALIKRIIKGDHAGLFAAFKDWVTYTRYKRGGLIR